MPVPLLSGAVLTNQVPEALVMPLKCRMAPSDSVTVPVVLKPICPDATVTVLSPRMWTRLVGVRVPATLRPTIESSNPLAAVPVSASSPADPRKVKVFPSPGSALSCRADAAVVPMANTSPELLPMAVLKVRLPPIAVMVFGGAAALTVSDSPQTVPKPLSDPLDVPLPNEMPEASVSVPPAIRIVPLVTFCVALMANEPRGSDLERLIDVVDCDRGRRNDTARQVEFQRSWRGSAYGKHKRARDETSAGQVEDAAGRVRAGCDCPLGSGPRQ